jgi:hypothetical protein
VRRADTTTDILAAISPAEELRNLESASLLGARTAILVAEVRADTITGWAESRPGRFQAGRSDKEEGMNLLLRVLSEALLAAIASVRLWAEARALRVKGRGFLKCIMIHGFLCMEESESDGKYVYLKFVTWKRDGSDTRAFSL